ncbi:hypothetical protein [Chryseobacterium vrystaatense]|uniref:ParB/Sulfiredoxin domain-containing protein n=1 Tax=Chryseobacterium vrystaatense TaxID=307480 RepID=A0ABR4UHM5_9FLAO|nr:hypothetical protein [Chryseobacterium vrystaatense]KFF24114.1 hypothetical protein IW16_22360 [Chryseobacterium vrystaatense]
MKLTPSEIELNKIMIDPYNPRFVNERKVSQETLVSEMLQSSQSKELLKSMQQDIKWVNRIVVQKKDTHQFSEKLQKLNQECEYVVIEGNTRVACLKSLQIEGYNDLTLIPVLLAEKEEDESDDEFWKQVRITQGIANVTTVKEWSQVAKAKHLNSLYEDSIEGQRSHDVYKQISNELGIGLKEVRESIIRFKIYSKITELSDPISDDNWGYLEAFDKNISIREKIGINKETNEFQDNDEEYYEEILIQIPQLINQALHQGLNTKQFRDIIIDISKDKDSSEEFNSLINEILDPNSGILLVNLSKKIKTISDKEHWELELNQIFEKISSFPSVQDWAVELKEKLELINAKIDKHLHIISN